MAREREVGRDFTRQSRSCRGHLEHWRICALGRQVLRRAGPREHAWRATSASGFSAGEAPLEPFALCPRAPELHVFHAAAALLRTRD